MDCRVKPGNDNRFNVTGNCYSIHRSFPFSAVIARFGRAIQ
jgi:hypothetical protein